MIKAAIIPITIALLLASAPGSYAQPPSADGAVPEALRRQAAVKDLHDLITNAGDAQRRHDLALAAKLYDSAWEKVIYIGPANMEREAEVVKSGLASVRMELARAAQRRGDTLDASVQVKDILRVDPHNLTAIEFQRQNDQLIASQ